MFKPTVNFFLFLLRWDISSGICVQDVILCALLRMYMTSVEELKFVFLNAFSPPDI